MAARRTMRSERFLDYISRFDKIAVVSHNNPDPDAISSGWALKFLIETKLDKKVQVLAGGAVWRAENLRMIELLKPPITLVDQWLPEDDMAVILIDCAPTANNHLFGESGIEPAAVIDHHEVGRKRFRVGYRDIRPRVAALSSIAAEYLREQKVEPGARLATSLMYAINTETTGWQAVFSPTDRRAISWLNDYYDPAWFSDIQNAPLTREYFGDLLLALEKTFIYEDAALCFLPRATGPEIAAEVAYLLLRCKGVERVLCAAVVGEDLLISARTSRAGGDAVSLLTKTLKKIGFSGGHRHRAGGKVPGLETRAKIDEMQTLLRGRWLTACGIQQSRGSRLVALKEIVTNL